MQKIKKISVIVLVLLFTAFTFLSYNSVYAAQKQVVPQISFVTAPVTEYTVGDRVKFDISAPNYGGRVEYRVILWENSKKTANDLWNSSNGYSNRYYTKWQPYGNNTFTLGWPINEPGTYRITVYVKRVGISNNKAALKGMNCDSYKESVAFVVKPAAEPPEVVPKTEEENNATTVPVKPETTEGGKVENGTAVITPGAGGGGGVTPGTGTNTAAMAVEAAGVMLSNGTAIAGTRVGTSNEFYVDLSSYAWNIGARTSITVNKDCQLEIMGTKFAFNAHTPKIFGPKDFGMEDNDPPGIGIGNLRDNYANSSGYYTDSVSMTDEANNKVTLTIKMKVK